MSTGGHVVFRADIRTKPGQTRSGQSRLSSRWRCPARHQHCKYDRNENERRHISHQMTALGRIVEGLKAALSALNVLNSRTQTVLVGSYRSTTPKWGVDHRWQI